MSLLKSQRHEHFRSMGIPDGAKKTLEDWFSIPLNDPRYLYVYGDPLCVIAVLDFTAEKDTCRDLVFARVFKMGPIGSPSWEISVDDQFQIGD